MNDKIDLRSDAEQPDIRIAHKNIVSAWVDLWNGNYGLAEGIISPDIQVRAALMDGGNGSAIDGVPEMIEFVKTIRAAFSDLRFTIDVGPIIDGDYIVIRWLAVGTYSGGFPNATAAVGTKITFTGADILGVKHGLIMDYWLNADTLLLVAQLKVLPN